MPRQPVHDLSARPARRPRSKALIALAACVTSAIAGCSTPKALAAGDQPSVKVTVEDTSPGGAQFLDVAVMSKKSMVVVQELRLRVKRIEPLRACYPPQGGIPVTARYDVTMPAEPALEQVFKNSVKFEVKPESNERFQVYLRQEHKDGNTDVYAYQFAVEVDIEGVGEPLALGNVILTAPAAPERFRHIWDPENPRKMEELRNAAAAFGDLEDHAYCLDSNSARLSQLLMDDGMRSESMRLMPSKL